MTQKGPNSRHPRFYSSFVIVSAGERGYISVGSLCACTQEETDDCRGVQKLPVIGPSMSPEVPRGASTFFSFFKRSDLVL